MEITTIGFGAWAIGGGGWEFGWGPQDDQKSIDAIHKALDEGINWRTLHHSRQHTRYC
jgi:aryl-alcohol dehydrogenase-like predicted oxidoreductase